MADEQIPEGTTAPALTEDQKLSNMVNAAVGNHMKRSLPKFLEEALTPHMTSLKEQFASLRPAEPSKAPKEGDDTNARVTQLEAMLKKEQAARAAERQQTRNDRAYGDLKAVLAGKVRPEAVEMVAKLIKADGRLVVTDSGEASLRVGDMEHDLSTGIAEFLKTGEAQMFLPAPGYGPSSKPLKPGQRPPARTGGPPPANETPAQKAQRLIASVKQST